MKKRNFCNFMFLFIFSAIFANDVEMVDVGNYRIIAIYQGQNSTDSVLKRLKESNIQMRDAKPSREQIEWIKYILNLFETTKGDVYRVDIFERTNYSPYG